MPFVAVRLRGSQNLNKGMKDTMNILGLKRVNTLVVLPENPTMLGMLRKVENFITYGKMPDEDVKSLGKTMRLKPPRGGLRSIKKRYPKGDLGYRGDNMKELIQRMM